MQRNKSNHSVSGFFLSRSASTSASSSDLASNDGNPELPEGSGRIVVRKSSSDDQIVHFGRRGEVLAPAAKKDEIPGSQLRMLKEVNARHPIRPPFVHKPGASRVLSWTQIVKARPE